MRDRVTRQSPQTTTFWRERRAEADSNQGPSACQPNTLPLGQTSSQAFLLYDLFDLSLSLSISYSLPLLLSVCLSLFWSVKFWVTGVAVRKAIFLWGKAYFKFCVLPWTHIMSFLLLLLRCTPPCAAMPWCVVVLTLWRLEKQTTNIRLAEEQAKRGRGDLHGGADDLSSMSEYGTPTFSWYTIH